MPPDGSSTRNFVDTIYFFPPAFFLCVCRNYCVILSDNNRRHPPGPDFDLARDRGEFEIDDDRKILFDEILALPGNDRRRYGFLLPHG